MWPFRPEKLSDVISREDLRRLLGLAGAVGSTLSLVEKLADGSLGSVHPLPGDEARRSDPFCTFFRHGKSGGKLAFDGADEACERCEVRFARRLLQPGTGPPLVPNEFGVVHLRCHMGLTDYQVPVTVGGEVVASLIAGRRIESEDDRHRIRKTVGKLGKLTRKEAEAPDAGDRLIEPADEKARERLLEEISAVPLQSPDLGRELSGLSGFLGRLAARGFESVRRPREDAIVERIDARQGELPRSFGDLRQETSSILDAIRGELGVDFLAFFAVSPKELDDPEARASLVSESGLETGTARRFLELDWFKLPHDAAGGDVARGLSAVSAAIRAVIESRDSPGGLKDRVTKCAFFSPVEIGSHLRSALAFGPARSATAPETADYQFLARVARAVSRRYYALAAELERRWLADQLSREGSARKEAEVAKKELERTENFAHFDARKLLNQVLERAGTAARGRGVELDTRELMERVIVRGDRQAIGEVFRRLLEEGIARTFIDPESKKGAPVRVFLKRTRTKLYFGVEAIGDFLGPGERRDLFSTGSRAGNGSPAGPAGAPPRGSLHGELATLRRHEGRLKVESERLHRLERDRNRWIGKVVFLVELPLPVRSEPEGPSEEDGGRLGGRSGRRRRRNVQAQPMAQPAVAVQAPVAAGHPVAEQTAAPAQAPSTAGAPVSAEAAAAAETPLVPDLPRN
jgi:hypothetical protein